MLYNVRSSQNKIINVIELIQSENIDIIFIQESWLKAHNKVSLARIGEFGYKVFS